VVYSADALSILTAFVYAGAPELPDAHASMAQVSRALVGAGQKNDLGAAARPRGPARDRGPKKKYEAMTKLEEGGPP